jgi:hypothetical protein
MVLGRLLNGFWSGSIDFHSQIREFGLGGARTHNPTRSQRGISTIEVVVFQFGY